MSLVSLGHRQQSNAAGECWPDCHTDTESLEPGTSRYSQPDRTPLVDVLIRPTACHVTGIDGLCAPSTTLRERGRGQPDHSTGYEISAMVRRYKIHVSSALQYQMKFTSTLVLGYRFSSKKTAPLAAISEYTFLPLPH